MTYTLEEMKRIALIK